MSRKRILFIAILIPFLIFAAILFIGLLFNGQSLPDWYKVLWNLLPLFLFLPVPIYFVGIIVIMVLNKRDGKSGSPYQGRIPDRDAPFPDKEDMIAVSEDESDPTTKIIVESRVRCSYNFIVDGTVLERIMPIKVVVLDVPKGEHHLVIADIDGTEIFRGRLHFRCGMKFTIKSGRNRDTVKIKWGQ